MPCFFSFGGIICLFAFDGLASRRTLCHYLRMNADSKACTFDVDSQYVELAVEVFSMLADATRVRLILALREGEMPVNALAEKVGKPAATVSQHLAKMRLVGMVSTRQEGTKVYYRMQNGHARQLVVDAVHQAEHTLGTAPHHGA
jgi:DNA-binding transcriptional ArsR family regulator